jgi:putative heme-binding domain-containing protein
MSGLRLRLQWLSAVLALVTAACAFAGDEARRATLVPDANKEPPFGKRVPWITSRITGSPEPPAPYQVERAFPKLKFSEPVELVTAPGSDRLFLVELKGRIGSFASEPDGSSTDLLVDLKALHPDLSAAYGLAFHPKFQQNRFVYVCYVLKDGDPNGTRVSRFTVSSTEPPKIDLGTELVLITWLGGGHNGGSIHFGKDGLLYISTGDGKGPDPPDTLDTGQDISDLLSSILRIDVDRGENGRPYRIPPDNPLLGTPGARPEVWCYGLRNPWRMSFDAETGDLWVGDVGWELWEMIYRAQPGGNYGWSYIEGKQLVKPEGRRGPTPIVPPTMLHPHSEAASITGGYVYHGKRLPQLRGAYIYGDFETGKIWALRHRGGVVTSVQELADTTLRIAAFGVDARGELFLIDHYAGTLYQLVRSPAASFTARFPRQLSETGLFADTPRHILAPGVIPFSVNAELWNDHATAERFVALPGDSTIVTTNGPWGFPADAVLARTISLELERGRPSSRCRLETQVLHFHNDAWSAYTYRWNDAQTDAELVDNAGAEQVFSVKDPRAPGGVRKQVWRFHSRAECLRCHNPWGGTLLAFTPLQLNRDHNLSAGNAGQASSLSPAQLGNQLRALAEIGLFDQAPASEKSPRLFDLRDTSASLEARARSYLHVNCSHCHREHAGGSVLLFMNYEHPLEKAGLIDTKPVQGGFGMAGARLLAPGDPWRSVLLCRTSKLGRGRMPYLGSSLVDEAGVRLLWNWIERMPPRPVADVAEAEVIVESRTRLTADTERLRSAASEADRTNAVERLLGSVSGALALLDLMDEPGLSRATRQFVIASATTHTDSIVRDLFARFLPEEKRDRTLGLQVKPETILALNGDAARGRKLFFEPSGAQCHTCHRVQGEGRDFGPDLSRIGAKYDRAQLLENILEPSRTIDPAYAGFTVETEDGAALSGLLVKKDAEGCVLKTLNPGETKIPTAEVVRLEKMQLSLMPEQLLQNLTAQEAADLLEFLRSLR